MAKKKYTYTATVTVKSSEPLKLGDLRNSVQDEANYGVDSLATEVKIGKFVEVK